jgi:S-adenosylmethionine:tRNA ribosyltransferase-isomerase
VNTDDFDFELPPELIAQTPARPRDSARLMVLDRRTDSLTHSHFHDIDRFLRPDDLLVLNQTRVIPARLYARKQPGGGKVELLLLKKEADRIWEVMAGGKGISQGKRLRLIAGQTASSSLDCEVIQVRDGPRRLVKFSEEIEPYLVEIGHVPLPPYIHRPAVDPDDYQTVFARDPGSVAAPTAGLHFTSELLDRLHEKGIASVYVTLHIGLDTFAPVTETRAEEHAIHSEWCRLGVESSTAINATRAAGGRIVAVGTTAVRTLETAARRTASGSAVAPFEGSTDLFILPGHQFQAVDALVTNFHLPRSTLLMLVSAVAGRERILSAYEAAKHEGYRFYSFGDAMLII